MHKTIYTFAFLLFLSNAFSQIVDIPDPGFKQYLINEGVDTNGDGEIQVPEAEAITHLTIFDGIDIEIHSIEGIKSFINLSNLSIDYIGIDIVDISGLENLIWLDISATEIMSVDARNCILLKTVHLLDPDLIGMVDFSGCTSLEKIDGTICADIIKLNNCTSLRELQFFNCHYSELELAGCENLTHFEAFDVNSDFTFDFAIVPALESFIINASTVVDLEVIDVPNLKILDLENISSLKVKDCPELEEISLFMVENIELSELPKLKDANLIYDSKLIKIDNCNALLSLNLGSFEDLVIENCNSIVSISSSNGYIYNAVIKNCSSIESLDMGSGFPSTWDFTGLSSLKSIVASRGPSNLILNGCYNLETFSIVENFAKMYDFSSCINLEILNLGDCFELNSLIIQNGSMETLDIGIADFLTNICVDPDEYLQTLFVLASLEIENVNVTTSCEFANGGEPFSITGITYFDENNDSCLTSEKTVPFTKFRIISDTGSEGVFYSNEDGKYQFNLVEGQYTVEPELLFGDYIFTSSPEMRSITFPDDGTPKNQDFCFIPSEEIVDIIEVNLIPLNVARPGFDAKYLITYTNTGNVTREGDIKLTFQDEFMDLVESQPMVNVQEEGFLSWSFDDLAPFESGSIEFTMNLNSPMDDPALNGGDMLDFRAEVGPYGNQTLTVYWSDLNQEVVNSFDPNDKTCLNGNAFDQELVGDYLKYMIRFENTGTAEAVNIVITDTLDNTMLDVRTLQVINASHEVETELTENVIKFIFKDIYLPFDDETNDGYVTFKVKTLPTLELGDDIQNTAEIFFDFNFPIVTNTTSTVISDFTAIYEVELESFEMKVSPNPTTEFVLVNSEIPIREIELWDIKGRLINKITSLQSKTQHRLSVDHLSAGIYFIKARSGSDYSIKKIVIE